MEEPAKLYDSEGYQYTITGSEAPNKVFLKGPDGKTQIIKADELGQKFSFYPPEVLEAAKRLSEMLKSGEINREDLRRLSDR